MVRPSFDPSGLSRRTRFALAVLAVLAVVIATAGYLLFVHDPIDRQGARIEALADSPVGDDNDFGLESAGIVTSRVSVANRSAGWSFDRRSTTWIEAPGRYHEVRVGTGTGTPVDGSFAETYADANGTWAKRVVPAGEEWDLEVARYRSRGWTVSTDRENRTLYIRRGTTAALSAVERHRYALVLLDSFDYRRVGTITVDGQELVRYEPVAGWVSREPLWATHYVAAATGSVLVEPETGTVVAADVTATIVETDTWAGALTDPRVELSVQFRRYQDPSVTVERPSWTTRVENATADA